MLRIITCLATGCLCTLDLMYDGDRTSRGSNYSHYSFKEAADVASHGLSSSTQWSRAVTKIGLSASYCALDCDAHTLKRGHCVLIRSRAKGRPRPDYILFPGVDHNHSSCTLPNKLFHSVNERSMILLRPKRFHECLIQTLNT